MVLRSLVPSTALALLSAPLSAQIDVPGDYSDLQVAIDHARSGDVIVVHGGTWGPIVIDKSLTLIGDPRPLLMSDLSVGLQQVPPIELAGPGTGEVVLANVEVGGRVCGFQIGIILGGIHGGGFDELHVFDSAIAAPRWGLCLTGVAEGAEAIDVAVPYVLVVNSTVLASDGAADDCYLFVPDGVAGIRAPASTVVVLDSSVRGGSFRRPCVPVHDPSGPCGGAGGAGGDGVVATKVVEAGSKILGGPGATWTTLEGKFCERKPDGVPVAAAEHDLLLDDLYSSGPAQLGQPFVLSWTTPGPVAGLFWSHGPAPPFHLVAGLLEVHLDPASMRLLRMVPAGGGTRSFELSVPVASALIGFEAAFQAFDPPDHVTRPVVAVLRP